MSSLNYYAPGTAAVFTPSGGTIVFTPTSLANAAGRVSAQWDRGAGSKPSIFRVESRTRAAVAPVVGTVVNVYLVYGQASSTMIPGKVGAADAAVSSENLFLNAKLIGTMICDVAGNTNDFVMSEVVRDVRAQYVSVGWFNLLGQALSATAGDHVVTMTPMSDEAQ